MSDRRFGVLLDLDGTLVDSVYHHVLAWHEAFHAHGHAVALADVHQAIGMGSDRLVPHLLGAHVSTAADLADHHERRFLELAATLEPTRGARALVDDLRAREVPHRLATSAGGAEAAALLRVLDRDVAAVDSDAVAGSKPAPDLLLAACDALGLAPAEVIVVGDSPWDVEAAARVGARSLAVRCGGFSATMLRARGAAAVFADPRELVGQL